MKRKSEFSLNKCYKWQSLSATYFAIRNKKVKQSMSSEYTTEILTKENGNTISSREDYFVLYIVRGSVSITLQGQLHRCEKGDFFFLNPSESARLHWQKESVILNLKIDSGILHAQSGKQNIFLSLEGKSPEHNRQAHTADLIKTFWAVRADGNSRDGFGEMGAYYTLMDDLLKHYVVKNPISKDSLDDYGTKMLRYIHMNYRKHISLDEVAGSLFISTPTASRVFYDATGVKFGDYVRTLRLNKAKELLETTGDSITEIALNVGFGSPSAMNKLFLKYIGTTPSEYRNENSIKTDKSQTENDGMTDLVEALRWIRENGKRFGGNPDNVTLFGQSGGGDKIISLMQIPAAEGLFHRAIIQSGVLPIDNTLDVDLKNGNKVLAKLMMEKLGGDINSLIQADYHDLVKVYLESKKECRIKGIPCTGNRPIPNDYYIGDPRIKGFSSFAKEIPVLCGTTYAEISFGEEIPDKNELLDNKVQQLLEEKFSKEGLEQILPIYKRLWPERKSIDLLYLDSMIRGEALSFMNAFSREAKCECYSYIFAPVFPYNGGKNAWHCSEIPFIFHNTDKVPVCNFKGAKDLENSMAEIWMNFARHGKPDGDGFDSWPPYEGSKGCTIIMSNSRMRLMDSDTELQELIRKYGKKPEFMIED